VSKSLQEDVYTHSCVFNPITNIKAVVDILDLDDEDEADLVSKIHQADRLLSTVMLSIIKEMKGSSPQVTSAEIGERLPLRERSGRLNRVGSKVFHAKHGRFGIVKNQVGPPEDRSSLGRRGRQEKKAWISNTYTPSQYYRAVSPAALQDSKDIQKSVTKERGSKYM